MKKLSIVLAAAFMFSLGASAQTDRDAAKMDQRARGDRKHGNGGKMMSELNLSEDQKAKIKTLNQDFKAKHDALKAQSGTLTVDQMKAQRKALMESHKTQVRSILTADQQAKMDEMKKKRMENRGQRKKMNRQV